MHTDVGNAVRCGASWCVGCVVRYHRDRGADLFCSVVSCAALWLCCCVVIILLCGFTFPNAVPRPRALFRCDPPTPEPPVETPGGGGTPTILTQRLQMIASSR